MNFLFECDITIIIIIIIILIAQLPKDRNNIKKIKSDIDLSYFILLYFYYD